MGLHVAIGRVEAERKLRALLAHRSRDGGPAQRSRAGCDGRNQKCFGGERWLAWARANAETSRMAACALVGGPFQMRVPAPRVAQVHMVPIISSSLTMHGHWHERHSRNGRGRSSGAWLAMAEERRLSWLAQQASGFRPSCKEEALWMLREYKKSAESVCRTADHTGQQKQSRFTSTGRKVSSSRSLAVF